MLADDRKEEMKEVCSLAIHSEKVMKTLNKAFEEHVTKVGFDAIEKCAAEAVKVSSTFIRFPQCSAVHRVLYFVYFINIFVFCFCFNYRIRNCL